MLTTIPASRIFRVNSRTASAFSTTSRPPFGRELLRTLRHQRDLVGTHLQRDTSHLFGHPHLDVQLGADRLPKQLDITVLYVTAVRTQVHRDPLRSGPLGNERSRQRLGLARLPRFADGGDVIDVDG